MRIGMVGLGRMGGNMTVRLLRHGHEVVAYDPNPEARARAVEAGAGQVPSLGDLARALDPPRAVWLMVPAGRITDETISHLGDLLEAGDRVIDGGNTNWRESMRHAEDLASKGITLLDCGTSGGVWGLEEGYCLMVGGDRGAFGALEPVFTALAPPGGLAHVGPSGAGHFVKMVHNGIEYGLLAAYGEGFEILERSGLGLDLGTIAELWRHGSVVRSWLLDLLAPALARNPGLEGIRGYVEDSGEGRWAVQTAIELAVPAPIAALSLFHRFASRQDESFAAKVIAALRSEFGGHAVHPEEPAEAPAAAETRDSPEAVPGGEL